MGLDVSHDCWSGAYGAFGRWRDHLAQVAGYDMVMAYAEGESVHSARPTIMIDWGHVTADQLNGVWKDEDRPRDPLIYLLAHYDTEGVLTPAEAKPLADRLEELLPRLDESKSGGHIQSMRGKTEQFIKGLRLAVDAGQDVEFY